MININDLTENAALSNEDLLRLYQNLDFRGFDLFYQRNHKLIYGYLLRILKNSADAEDVLQQVFLKIHSKILSYDPEKNALIWVFTIARRSAIDHLRRTKKFQVTGMTSQSDRYQPSFESSLLARHCLHEMFNGLKKEEVDLLIQRFFNEDSYDEIALVSSQKEENVRQKISRLIRKLQHKFPKSTL